MSSQSRHDVKNAFHFATLVADKSFDAEKQSREWYDRFIDVMRDLGFTIPRRTFELETSAELSVTVGAVAVRAIGAVGNAVLGGTKLGVLAKAAFDKLTTVENDLKVVDHKRKNKVRGMVGMAACVETDNNDVVMVVNCIQASAPNWMMTSWVSSGSWKRPSTTPAWLCSPSTLSYTTRSAKPWKTNSACAASRTFSSTTSDCRAALLQRRLVRLFVTRQRNGQNS